MMKRSHLIVFFVIVALLGSCVEQDNPEPTPDPTPKAPTAITLSLTSVEATAAGGSFDITVKSPFVPQVEKPSWVTVTAGTFKDYTVTMTMTVAANPNYETREATLTFKATGATSATLKVTQAAAEKPETPDETDAKLTNAKASQQAVKVYDFLREQAGKKMLSGVQSGGTANNNDRVNQVFTKTGKHPALAGYDYIYLQYSPTPESWTWQVNYGDISAAKEQWEKNGLVSFMWHWNVPTSKDAWEKGKAGNFDGYGFYSDKTNFSITNALASGTWENDFLLQDIEKVAGYLKLLKDAGIPVLWRPLHEAAGNYNVYGSNGAWFWWGRGGADACKRLWKLLRDKLEGEYGLDNLIWVWTLDATVGAEKDYASWYPGNDQVDIVGVDIYADDMDAKERQYNAAVALSGGHKLVTVSECGNIPDPAKCLSAGESWNWFMAWDLESYSLNTDAYWKSLMSSSRVLTRESMPSLK
jgi:mannan endo-1,4-beta-mannosidase